MNPFENLPEEGASPTVAPSSGNPFANLPDAEEDGGVLDTALSAGEETARAVTTGVVSLIQGIAEMGTAGLDLAFGTNTSRPTTEAFEYVKSYSKPETAVGQIGEELTAFALGFVPIVGWLGRASAVARGAKVIPSTSRFLRSADAFGASNLGKAALSTKAGLIGTTAAATLGYETIATPDGRATPSDTFDIFSPLKTEADTGLMGREEALRRLRNKARHGVTGAAASVVFDTALTALGAGARAVGRTEAASAAAKGIRSGFDLLGRGAMAVPGVAPVVRTGKRYFAPMGGADPRVMEEAFDTMARADMVNNAAMRGFAEYDAKLKNVIGGFKLPGKGKGAAKKAERDLFRFLNGTGPRLTAYGDDVAKAADSLLDTANNVRGSLIEALEREVASVPVGSKRKDMLEGALQKLKMFQDSEQAFLRRMFTVHKDPVAYYKSLSLTGKDKQLYDEAVEEVSWNMHKADYRSPQALESARMVVNDAIGLGSINNGMSPEKAIKVALDKARKTAAEAPKVGVFSVAMPRLKLTPTLLKPREPLVDDSPKLRQLMGEIDDPKQLYLQTVADMSKTTAALNFYRNLTDDAARMVTPLADAIPAIRAGQRPLFVRTPDQANDLTGFDITPFFQRAQERNIRATVPSAATAGLPPGVGGRTTAEKVIEDFEDELIQNGYVKLGSSEAEDLDGVFGGQYGSLTGMYVAPEALQAVTTPMRVTSDAMSDVLGMLTQLQGFSQKMTIVFNPESQVRNILGNSLTLAGNGNLGRNTDMFDVYTLFAANAADASDEGLKRLATKVGLSGTSESSLVIKALQEFRTAGQGLKASEKLRTNLDRLQTILPFRQFLESFYSDSDSFFKAVGVLAEESKLQNAFKVAGDVPDRRLLEELRMAGIAKRLRSSSNPELSAIEVIAADIVKDTMPIYNRVGAFVQGLDRFPILGNFMSFASEIIRNSVNSLDLGLKQMSFTVSPAVRQSVGEATAKAFETSIRAQGAQRMLSLVSVAGVLPQAAVRGSMALTGTTPEQMEAMYTQLAPYTKGQDIMILSNDQKGEIEYYNLSSLLPYSFVVDPAKAALRAYNEAGSVGKDEAKQILDGIWAGVTSYADPFLSPAMVTERVLDVIPRESGLGRGGVTSQGASVYLPADSPAEKLLSGLAHISAVFIPGYARELGEVRSGEFRPGRLTRAALGIPGPQGEEYDMSSEFATFMTGLRPMTLNLRRDFQFSGLEYTPRRQQLKSDATRRISAPDRTPEEMISGWNYYLDRLYIEQGRLYADIQAARKLGVTDQIIRRNLIKDANLGRDEVSAIMRGQFHPGTATEEMIKDIRRREREEGVNRLTSSSDIPFRLFNQMSRERAREPLVPVEAESSAPSLPANTFDAPAGNPFADLPEERQGAVTPPPAFDSAPAPSAPQLPSAPANRASLSPELLGDNPFSQSANMEIARRLSG